MINLGDKQKLKNFLYKRRKLVKDSPFYFTERFCKISSLNFNEVMYEAIDWGRKYDSGIENESQLCHTIL